MTESIPAGFRIAVVVSLTVAFVSRPTVFAESNQPTRPNILILLTDDMSHRCVTATGGTQSITPHIDAIAQRGTVMNNVVHQGGFSGAICTCSRAMMLTGRPLWSVTPKQLNYAGPAQLKTEDALYPEQFRSEGWHTFATGKWHNGNAALLRCFDNAEAITGGMLPFNKRDSGGARDNAIEIGMMNPSGIRITDEGEIRKEAWKGWSTDVFYEQAEAFLDTQWDQSKPFLMYVSTNAPHDPRHAPREILSRFQNIKEPPNFLPVHPFDNGDMKVRDEMVYKPPHTPEIVRRERAIYLAMCSQIDDRIGRLVAKLKGMNQYENTLILFTSDHGLAAGEHGLLGKQNLYDGSWRVPMIVAGPGVPKGQSKNGLAYLHGIYPTIASLAGISAPEHCDAFDFSGTILGSDDGLETVFGAYMPNVKVRKGVRAVRSGSMKLLVYTHSGRQQLFDLSRDQWETNDLIGDPKYKLTASELFGSLKNWMEKSGDPFAARM